MGAGMAAESLVLGAQGSPMVAWGLTILFLLIYFTPAIDARRRKVPDVGMIFVINLLLGWTVIGWIVALALAYRTPQAKKAEQMAQAFRASHGGPGPGWYADPGGVGHQRWWDGTNWTQHLVDENKAPLPSSPPPPA